MKPITNTGIFVPLRSTGQVAASLAYAVGVRPTFTKTLPINLLFLNKLRSDSGIIFNNLSGLKKRTNIRIYIIRLDLIWT